MRGASVIDRAGYAGTRCWNEKHLNYLSTGMENTQDMRSVQPYVERIEMGVVAKNPFKRCFNPQSTAPRSTAI